MTATQERSGWAKFTSNYDHHFESGAVAEYNAGGKYRVTREVEDAALAAGVAEPTDKPADDDVAAVSPPVRRQNREMTFAERRTPQKIVAGGNVHKIPSNPLSKAHPADPKAKRSEPLVESRPLPIENPE